MNIHWKDWCWSWISNSVTTWCKELSHWKSPWCWERLRAQEEGVTEDKIVRYHHWLNGHEFEQTLGDSEGQRSLACCSPWGGKVRHDLATEHLWHCANSYGEHPDKSLSSRYSYFTLLEINDQNMNRSFLQPGSLNTWEIFLFQGHFPYLPTRRAEESQGEEVGEEVFIKNFQKTPCQVSLITQLVKNSPAMQETPVNSWVRKIQWRRDRLPTPVFLGFPVAQLVKNLSAMWETWVRSWVGKICWRRERLPTPVFWPGEFHGL